MLFAQEPVFKNMTISILDRIAPHLAAARARSARIAQRHVESLHIRPPASSAPLGTLSGGNQQKVALAQLADASARACWC